MSKRTVFTTVTPLPSIITREVVMSTLHDHREMITLNPLVQELHPIKPPPESSAEEYHCRWYAITDQVQYLPGGLASGQVTYNACFHDLVNGLQTHCYAPLGLNIRGKWSLGGSLPGEPVAPVELGVGVPLQGLYLREDIDMKCNVMMTSFVKKTLKKSHASLVEKLVVKAGIVSAAEENHRLSKAYQTSVRGSQAPSLSLSLSPQHTQSTTSCDSDYGMDNKNPVSQHPAFQTQPGNNYSSLHPQALNIRGSVASSTGSADGSLGGRPYEQMAPSNKDHRASWQLLNPGRQSPAIPQGHQAYQNQNHYHHPPQSFQSVELPASDPRNGNPQRKERPVELE